MDGSHGNEGTRVDDSGTGLLRSKTDSGDNIECKELMEEQSQDMQEGDGDDDCTCQEAGAGVPGDEMEVDEPEGLRKSLKKSFKAAKRFLMRKPEEQGKEDNSTPTPSQEAQVEPQLAQPVPLNKDYDEYDFSHGKRGRAVIINNEDFYRSSMLGSRPGSSADAAALKEMFKKLGFDVKCYNNLTAVDIKLTLKKEADQYDHHNADCLAVAILSHGDFELQEKAWSYYHHKATRNRDRVRHDIIFGVDGSHLSTASVIRTFQDDRVSGLIGKPRLFFIQACRGADYDDGVDVAVVPGADNNDHGDDDEEVDASEEIDDGGCQLRPKKVIISHAPIFKDFLVMYATTPGHFAWRRSSGTWFIQSLHSVFTKRLTPHMSLTQALTCVTRMVAQGYESRGNETGKKQTPVIESMLIKDVYFTKK